MNEIQHTLSLDFIHERMPILPVFLYPGKRSSAMKQKSFLALLFSTNVTLLSRGVLE